MDSSVLGVSNLSAFNEEDSENSNNDDAMVMKRRLGHAERKVRDLEAELLRMRSEKAEQESKATAWKADVVRAQEENRKLKEYISDKEKKAGGLPLLPNLVY